MEKLRLNTDAVSWREVDGEVIALRLASSEYLSTNGTGTIVWKALVPGATRRELVEILTAEYGIEAERAGADVDAFVDVLSSCGLLCRVSDRPQSAGATVFDLEPPGDRMSELRRLPRLTWRALRLVWEADRTHLIATIVLQAAAAVTIMIQLLVTRELLVAAGDVSRGATVSSLYPWLAAVAACAAVLAVITALTTYEQKLLVELASRHAFNCIIDVSASVDLESFERSEFFDQLQRARNSGLYRLIDMVNSVTALTTGVLTSIGIAVVLFVLEPLLLPFVALAAIFPLVATILNSRQAYVFEYAMTSESRERQYLMELLTERQPAQEIRIFGSAPFLQQRYNALTAERLRRLRIFLRARLKVALLGSGGGMLGTAIGLVALIMFLRDGRMTIATALTAALAMQQLGSRLAGLTASIGPTDRVRHVHRRLRRIRPARRPNRSGSCTQIGGRQSPATAQCHVESVSFAYPGTHRAVLEDVSLEVGPGEVVALVGENGSGKTTLVKLICGLYRPNQRPDPLERRRRRLTSIRAPYSQTRPSSSRTTSSTTSASATTSSSVARKPRSGKTQSRRPQSGQAPRASSTSSRSATKHASDGSSTAGMSSPSASGNGWRSRVRSTEAGASWSSTSRLRRSTRVRRRRSSPRCANSRADDRCSSSHIDSRASVVQTGFTCSNRAASPKMATMTRSWPPAAATRSFTHCSQRHILPSRSALSSPERPPRRHARPATNA